MISIDKGIKIPIIRTLGRAQKYPVLDLKKVGDSFFVKNGGGDNLKLQRTISAICIMRIKKNKSKIKITVRQVDNPIGVRVWRVK